MSFNVLIEAVRRHPLVSLIITIAAILAFLAGIITNITTIVSFIQKTPFLSFIIIIGAILVVIAIISSATFFQRRALLKSVGELTPGANISMYRDKFG
jgi:hypothetical protein